MVAKSVLGCWTLLGLASACASPPASSLHVDTEAGRTVVRQGDRELIAYEHGPNFAIPHFFPLTSPSGKLLIAQHPEPYPHHRALWLTDRVQLEGGPDVDFYHHWKNYVDKESPELGHLHVIRHDKMTSADVVNGVALVEAGLTWITNVLDSDGTAIKGGGTPVLDQVMSLRVRDLGNGEALCDLTWALTASYGPVHFKSDWIHYGWPFLRISPPFAGDAGGVILSDTGARGQAETNGKYARWIDYSNVVEGIAEGVSVFIVPGPNGELPKWLTREYGTFGPRRVDAFSGTKFVLAEGESIHGRAGIFVHSGDESTARIDDRYNEYLSWVGPVFEVQP
jgi:hypothetical protein